MKRTEHDNATAGFGERAGGGTALWHVGHESDATRLGREPRAQGLRIAATRTFKTAQHPLIDDGREELTDGGSVLVTQDADDAQGSGRRQLAQ